MKKLINIILCLFLLGGCKSSSSVSIDIKLDRIEGIVELDYDTIKEKLNSPIDFIVYIGRPDCGDCKKFQPYLDAYIEENPGSGIYYLNIKSFRDAAKKEDATKEEKEFYENLREYLGFAWTPTIIRYSNGKKIAAFEFLDASYGRGDDEAQQQKLEKFVAEFQLWMKENLDPKIK